MTDLKFAYLNGTGFPIHNKTAGMTIVCQDASTAGVFNSTAPVTFNTAIVDSADYKRKWGMGPYGGRTSSTPANTGDDLLLQSYNDDETARHTVMRISRELGTFKIRGPIASDDDKTAGFSCPSLTTGALTFVGAAPAIGNARCAYVLFTGVPDTADGAERQLQFTANYITTIIQPFQFTLTRTTSTAPGCWTIREYSCVAGAPGQCIITFHWNGAGASSGAAKEIGIMVLYYG